MSTPLSFCDISTRFGQVPAPQRSIEEQTGWNPNLLFKDYLNKVRRHRKEQEEHAAEDALLSGEGRGEILNAGWAVGSAVGEVPGASGKVWRED